jgi:hypothetical protein
MAKHYRQVRRLPKEANFAPVYYPGSYVLSAYDTVREVQSYPLDCLFDTHTLNVTREHAYKTPLESAACSVGEVGRYEASARRPERVAGSALWW